MAWLRQDHNVWYVVVGSVIFVAWLALLSGLVGAIAWTLDERLNPRGAPLRILSLSYEDTQVSQGSRIWATIDVDKTRSCATTVQVAFIDQYNVERVSVLFDWVFKEPGRFTSWPSFQVPHDLAPGIYRTQMRGVWNCQDDDYFVASPISEPIEVVADDLP